jgi:hypothetical protein
LEADATIYKLHSISDVILFSQGPRPTRNAFWAARGENGNGAILFLCGFRCATIASGVVVNLCVNSSLSDHNTRIRNRLPPKIASLGAYENIPTSLYMDARKLLNHRGGSKEDGGRAVLPPIVTGEECTIS